MGVCVSECGGWRGYFLILSTILSNGQILLTHPVSCCNSSKFILQHATLEGSGGNFLFSFYILTYKNIFCMYSYFTANLNYMFCLHDCTWSMLLGTTSDQNTITGAMF